MAIGRERSGFNSVPVGKQVIISYSKNNIINDGIPMILDDEFEFRIQNEYITVEEILDKSRRVHQLKNLVEGVAMGVNALKGNGFTGRLTQYSIPQWAGTSPLQFSFNVSFFYDSVPGKSHPAKENVFIPMMNLMAFHLPTSSQDIEVDLPLIPKFTINGIISPIPSVFDIANKTPRSGSGCVSMQIGKLFYLPQVLIESADPTFSTEVDTDGYPVSGTMSLSCRTYDVITRNALATFGGLSVTSEGKLQ